MKRLSPLLLVFGLVATIPSLAHASGAYSETEKLLGWSDDGKTWAVLYDSQESQAMLIKTEGKVVFNVCDNDKTEYQECDITVNYAGSDKHTAIEQVNVETHKALAKYKLKRVSPAWRKAFKESFELKRGGYAGHPMLDSKCATKWTLTRKSDKKLIKKNSSTKADCLDARGGYMSANGKFLLLKIDSFYGPGEDSGDTSDDTSYEWIALDAEGTEPSDVATPATADAPATPKSEVAKANRAAPAAAPAPVPGAEATPSTPPSEVRTKKGCSLAATGRPLSPLPCFLVFGALLILRRRRPI